MDFDMRGLTLRERQRLIAWFISNYPLLEVTGRFRVFKFLNTLSKDENNAEFVANAMKRLMKDEEEEAELIHDLDEKETVLTGYR